jgi:hypothetical protein
LSCIDTGSSAVAGCSAASTSAATTINRFSKANFDLIDGGFTFLIMRAFR